MTEGVLCALITGAVTIVAQLIITLDAKHKDSTERAVRQQMLDDKLEAIEAKLDIHNGYAEKFANISTAITKIEKDIEYLKQK